MVLYPYKYNGIWVFDDDAVGLVKEAFVAGIPEILESLHKREEIKNPEEGFRLIFSAIPFPSHQLKGTWIGEEAGGNWYITDDGKKGWLCPALLKYFLTPPENIYIRVESLT